MATIEENTSITNAYQCESCGAPLVYKPGTSHLYCSYCGSVKNIVKEDFTINELRLDLYLQNFEKETYSTTKVVICANCKAKPTVNENLQSMQCPYCGSPLIESNVQQERYIKPSYVLPFRIDKSQTNEILTKWINSLWFAPNKLKKAILTPINLNGIYLPYWTYDAYTRTEYTGKRGDYHFVTVGSGKNKRTEVRTIWTNKRGTIHSFYDDILVLATNTLDQSIIKGLKGWNIKAIVKINDSFLAGFITEKYQIDLKQAFIIAKEIIKSSEKELVKKDIGGDKQQIYTMNMQFVDVTFKHILLPIYVSAFRYKQKMYAFYINGESGCISGKRPYSAIKITMAVIIAIILIGVLIWLYNN